jgi:hypothetical protein
MRPGSTEGKDGSEKSAFLIELRPAGLGPWGYVAAREQSSNN